MSSPLGPPSSDWVDLLKLHLVPGLGPRLTKALLERFGSARAALAAGVDELQRIPHIGEKLATALHRSMREINVDAELGLMKRHGAAVFAFGASDYPPPLLEIPDAPPLLYVCGNWKASDANAVAIVGSRRSSSYGQRTAERLASGLAHAGFTIVSGLARGVDGAAHRGALQAKGRTIAVLAGGLSRIYPPEHADLAKEVESNGALISEAPMGMEPLANMFPQRNRIISGLSRGVVVVEAAAKSGALLTARHALEQGRPVFAVPGPIDNAGSDGTNRLIRDGAILIRSVEDIIEELDGIKPIKPRGQVQPLPEMNESQQRVWEFLENQTRHVDEIARHLSSPVHQITGDLMTLEMKKILRRLPGNMYERR